MLNIEDIIVSPSMSMKDVLKVIDSGQKQIAVVLDQNKKLIGTVNDGDIRRALLKGIGFEDTIENIYSRNPFFANVNDSKEKIIKLASSNRIHQIPIVDNSGNLVGLDILDELLDTKLYPNHVVLMVGGLGQRLRPLTEKIPKPMLKVGNKPILETIVNKFAESGFYNITMCVNYQSHIIQDHFGDGSHFGVNIDYVFEEQKLGTAGALCLICEQKDPFFVMNGDLLTNINFQHLHDYHMLSDSIATMCVKEYDFQVPYGVVNINNDTITSIEEKPVHNFYVNAGIYMLSPDVLKHIPINKFFDMTTLFNILIKLNKKTTSFPIREYWLDIGEIREYERANDEFDGVF